jgi:hypothetical protein
MGVLGTHSCETGRNHVPVLFATKERKTEVGERKSEQEPAASLTFVVLSYRLRLELGK